MKKLIYILITIGLVISFTSCNSKELSTLSSQSQTSNKIITSNSPKQVAPNSDSTYTPSVKQQEQSADKTVTYPLHFVSYENNVENNKIALDINLTRCAN